MRPANGIHQGCEIWGDVHVERRTVLMRVGVIVFTAVRSVTAGKIVGALGVNKVDFVKVRIWDSRLGCAIVQD